MSTQMVINDETGAEVPSAQGGNSMSRTSSPIVTSYSAEHQIGTTKPRTHNPRRFVKVGQLLTVSENVFEE